MPNFTAPQSDAISILKSFNNRIIALNPVYVKITGDLAAGVVLSQLLYWHGNMGYKKFYKIDSEIADECAISTRQMERVKKSLKKLPFMIITKEGLPCKTFYDFDYALLIEKICNQKGVTSLHERGELAYTKRGSCTPQKVETHIHKTTNRLHNRIDHPKFSTKKKQASSLPDKVNPSEKCIKFANENNIDLNLEMFKFRSSAEANGRLYKNWTAAFTTWVGNSVTFRNQGKATGQQGSNSQYEVL